MIAFRLEPQALLMVYAGTDSPKPALWEICRATFGRTPAWRALPKMTSPTAFAGTPLRSRAPLAAATPRSAAERGLSAPPNFPLGVLTAPAATQPFVIG